MDDHKSNNLLLIGFGLNFCLTFALIWVVGLLWVLQFRTVSLPTDSVNQEGLVPLSQLSGENVAPQAAVPAKLASSEDGVYRNVLLGITADGFTQKQLRMLFSDNVKLMVANFDTEAHTFAIDYNNGRKIDGGTIEANQEKTFYLGGFSNAEATVNYYSSLASNPAATISGELKICN